MWHVVFEVKILNQKTVKKHKDHCEIRESKDFFITWTTDLLTVFFLVPKGKYIFFILLPSTFYNAWLEKNNFDKEKVEENE